MEELVTYLGPGTAADARRELAACNAACSRFGLILTPRELEELAEARQQALTATGRVEFGGGILPKLAAAFCGSPYLNAEDYAATLAELQEAFYYFKNESRDALSDDELLRRMAELYDGPAGGSMDYLCSTALPALCRRLREKRL